MITNELQDYIKRAYSGITKHYLLALGMTTWLCLKKYVDCFTEYASLIEAQAFEIGFKLAVKLMKD